MMVREFGSWMASQSLTVRSPLADARCRPSGRKAIPSTISRWPLKVELFQPGACVPEANEPILPAGGEPFAIRGDARR